MASIFSILLALTGVIVVFLIKSVVKEEPYASKLQIGMFNIGQMLPRCVHAFIY